MGSPLLIVCVAYLFNLDKAQMGPKEHPGESHKND